MHRLALAPLLLFCAACSAVAPAQPYWPAADRLFRSDARWRDVSGQAHAWIPGDGDVWRWPSHGILHAGALTLFTWRMARSDDDAFGFRAVGWDVFRVRAPDGPIGAWTLELLPGFATPIPAIMGVAVLEFEGWIHAYAVQEPGSHDVYLLRWSCDDFASGQLSAPEWYTDGAWIAHAALDREPTAVILRGHTEFSVHRSADGRFGYVQSEGFGASTVVARTADRPEGPWSPPVELFRPEESDRPGVLVYAAKAHPELEGAPLVVTYATNTTDFGALVRDESLYYPRFLRLALPAATTPATR